MGDFYKKEAENNQLATAALQQKYLTNKELYEKALLAEEGSFTQD
jgi:hypothetical protein